ncbi:LysR substrate-binding domain-containing protein [Ottowia sp.]|uniref:LysR family transcriptional regulator n=1 Tax=Ottowia sp. TaxID=1898956 RepID=UPI0039E4D094
MNLHRLRYLVQLSELFVQGRAHEHWPQLASHIGAIERELGVKLVEHKGATLLGLTAAAREYVPTVDRILKSHDAAMEEAAAMASGLSGVLRLGITEDATTMRLSVLLRAFARAWPTIEVQLIEGRTSTLVEALRRHDIDLVLAPIAPDEAQVSSTAVWEAPWQVAMPPGHRLARHQVLRCEDLADEDLVMADPIASPQGHDLIDKAFRKASVEPRIVALMLTRSSMLTLVACGMGCTFVPRHMPITKLLDLRPLQVPPMVIHAIYSSEGLGSIASRFLDFALHPPGPME